MEKFLQPILYPYQRLKRDYLKRRNWRHMGFIDSIRKKIIIYKMLDRKLRRSRRTVTHLFGPTRSKPGLSVSLKSLMQKLLKLRNLR